MSGQSWSPLDVSPVIPVVVNADVATAVPLAQALVAGGVPIVEVALRTPHALEAVRAILAEVPGIVVGVGSVLTPAQLDQALAAGARFLVSPGTSPSLLAHLAAASVPVLPGVATVSEVLTALDHGLTELRFFPAEAAGGPDFLAAVAGPVPHVRFCPAGGVTTANLRDYLALPNVGAVAGTWLAPRSLVETADWSAITALASAAVAAAL